MASLVLMLGGLTEFAVRALLPLVGGGLGDLVDLVPILAAPLPLLAVPFPYGSCLASLAEKPTPPGTCE